MPRIRWPLGSVPVNTNPTAAAQDPVNKAPEPQARPENAPAEEVPKDTSSVPKVVPSKKRKSTKAAPSSDAAPVAKKPKTTPKAVTKDAVKKAAKEILKDAASDLLDVSEVTFLEDEDDDGVVAIYDTCDTVRRKIRALLAKDGITQAAFMRAIATAAWGETSTRKIQSTSLNAFMKQKGPLAGNTNGVYYAAYVFFEKMRIKQKKPKTNDREIMEELHFDGVDTKVLSGSVRYIGLAGSQVVMDKYGSVRMLP